MSLQCFSIICDGNAVEHRKAGSLKVLLDALKTEDLDQRVTEALLWLLAHQTDLDWRKLILARTIPFAIETLKERYQAELQWQYSEGMRYGPRYRADRDLAEWIEMIEEDSA